MGLGYGDQNWLDQEFRASDNARIGCGFITWSLDRQPQLLHRALAHKPTAVMLSFGDSQPYAEAIKQNDARLICQIQSLSEAKRAIEIGADIVVAQGTEAGGHGAARSTFPLVPAVVDLARRHNPDVVVLAAGGVADGRGLAAALMLGAEGALIGTRFLAAKEALPSSEIKARVVSAEGDHTIRTRVFDIIRRLDWPRGYTGRALQNAFSAQWDGREAELERQIDQERVRYANAEAANDLDTRVIFAGEAVDLVQDICPAGEIVKTLVRDAEAVLGRVNAMLESS